MSEQPNSIKVAVTHEEEIQADHADLYVVIRGSSLVTGRAAFTKAREVNQLVADLAHVGIGEEHIHLESVHATVSTGLLNKSSSANYSLRIECLQLDKLVDMLGVITAQKNTSLSRIEWNYPEGKAQKQNWLDSCIQQANEKARRIADGLGVKLEGVHNFAETYTDTEAPNYMYPQAIRSRYGVQYEQSAPVNLGMEVSHTKLIQLSIEVTYLVSGYQNS